MSVLSRLRETLSPSPAPLPEQREPLELAPYSWNYTPIIDLPGMPKDQTTYTASKQGWTTTITLPSPENGHETLRRELIYAPQPDSLPRVTIELLYEFSLTETPGANPNHFLTRFTTDEAGRTLALTPCLETEIPSLEIHSNSLPHIVPTIPLFEAILRKDPQTGLIRLFREIRGQRYHYFAPNPEYGEQTTALNELFASHPSLPSALNNFLDSIANNTD